MSLPASIYFLNVNEVKEIHANQISTYGGSEGVRDEGLLASAIAQPSSGFGEQYLHTTLPSMAAAYLFHLVMNHPFVDGNKRTGLATALVFLDMNGLTLNSEMDNFVQDGQTEMEKIVLSVITKQISKDKLTELFETNSNEIRTKD